MPSAAAVGAPAEVGFAADHRPASTPCSWAPRRVSTTPAATIDHFLEWTPRASSGSGDSTTAASRAITALVALADLLPGGRRPSGVDRWITASVTTTPPRPITP